MKDMMRNEVKIGDEVVYADLVDDHPVLKNGFIIEFDYDWKGRVLAVVGISGYSVDLYGHQLMLVK